MVLRNRIILYYAIVTYESIFKFEKHNRLLTHEFEDETNFNENYTSSWEVPHEVRASVKKTMIPRAWSMKPMAEARSEIENEPRHNI